MQLQTLLKVSLSISLSLSLFLHGARMFRACTVGRITVSPLSRARDLDRSVSQSRDRFTVEKCRRRAISATIWRRKVGSSVRKRKEISPRRGAHCSIVQQQDAFYLVFSPLTFLFFTRTLLSIILSITTAEISIIFAAT